ncbi:MAG: putative AAA+ superfamily ATPase [Arcticibacterium sp.]|jgi:predicted AAA+ superfamily ATPase
MHVLEKIHERLLAHTDIAFKRYLYDEIDFEDRMIAVTGCRGVGKTTLLLQYLKEKGTGIYFSLDHLYFATNTMLGIIENFYEKGYRTFALDEVHKYENWSRELKNIYDSYPDVKLLITSSSALDIMKGSADLSRRLDTYTLKGLSFREYLAFENIVSLPAISLEYLISNHITIAEEWVLKHPISKLFKAYLKKGYYPFYKETGKKYPERVRSIINQVIEVDLPPIFNIDYSSVRQIKKLLGVISEIAPFSPNIAKLASQLEIPRSRVLLFLDYLDKAGILNTLKAAQKSESALTKPDKVFLNNTNIAEALSINESNIGTGRESFFMNVVSTRYQVSTPAKGDFMVDNTYVFEIGGKNKTTHQIYGVPNAYLAKDDIAVGSAHVIPLWLFGFLY